MKSWSKLSLALTLLLLAVACSDDATKKGSGVAEECPDGTRYNPILDQCEAVAASNNGSDPDAGSGSNNGTAVNNGGAANNGTSSNNGMVEPDAGNDDVGGDTDGTSDNNMIPCGFGSILGKACAPSGEALAAADVTVTGTDCDGNEFTLTTRTGSDGSFQLDDVPSGRHELKISTGSFENTRPVVVQPDETTDLTSAAEKVCLDQNVEIAVIGGNYDHVEGILDDLNLTYEMKGDDQNNYQQALDFLQNKQEMMNYDIIFINCGDLVQYAKIFGAAQTIGQNLRDYVAAGKSVYASDWSHAFVEIGFPDAVDFLGEDTDHEAPKKGYAPQTINASVDSMDFQTLLGSNTATIEFPHDPANDVINNNWVVAEGVGADAVLHFSGDAQLCGPGSFADPCPSSSNVQQGAPLLVTYKDPTSGGTVVFTSFHNERQSDLNQDMERILRFLIFQL